MAQVGRGTGPGTSPKLWDQSHIRDRGPVTDRTDCNLWICTLVLLLKHPAALLHSADIPLTTLYRSVY